MADKKFICVVCQKERADRPNYICSRYGAQDKITMYCSGCDSVHALGRYALENLRQILTSQDVPRHIPEKDGIVIKVNNYTSCPEPLPVKISVFSFPDYKYIN